MKLTIAEVTDICPTEVANAIDKGLEVVGGLQAPIDTDAADIDAMVARKFGPGVEVYDIDEYIDEDDGSGTWTAVVVRANHAA